MRKFSLTTLILTGLLMGIGIGLVFGERSVVLAPIGNGFIRLLQMAVLPYFIVALPLGFGRLNYQEARMLAMRLGLFSVVIWALAFLLVALLPLTFPALESASFFSSNMIESPDPVDFVELYIPANPFDSLSKAIIPGVVVFGIAMGVALIGVPEKKQLLTVLDSLADALGRITGFVVRLTPIGVFALAASAAGTMTLEDLSRLQVYFVAYTVGVILLAFWLVPMLVSSLTPFSYRDVVRVTRDPLVTGFTTGNLLVVLAMLADNCKQLFREQDEQNYRHAESIIDVSLPIAFTFPNLGVVLLLLFVPFAGWFTGNPVGVAEYPKLFALGFFSFFGSVEIGLPFVLQQLRIPTDMFQLHVVTLVYIGRLATMLAVMHLAGVALLSAAGNARWLRFKPKRITTFAGGSLVILLLTIGTTRFVLRQTVDQAYSKNDLLTAMSPIEFSTTGTVYRELPNMTSNTEDSSKASAVERTTLGKIRERGLMTVGYDPNGMPFSFFNANDELVGFDIEMVQALASELDVEVEYYPYTKTQMAECLNEARCCDLLVGGLFTTTRRIERMRFTEPYLDLNLAFIVKDHRRDEFSKLADIQNPAALRIAVLERPYFGTRVQQSCPRAKVVRVDSPAEYFESPNDFDALVMSAEAGSAWTLLHPSYSVVIPQDATLTVSVGYPTAIDSTRFENVLSRWIHLKKNDGTIQRFYEHWIEGRNAQESGPRWNLYDKIVDAYHGTSSKAITLRSQR